MSASAERFALVTGAASGIGRATVQALRDQGARVIGVDLRDADITADLSTADGRAALVAEASRLAPDGLDLVVAAAGVSFPLGGLPLAVNFFGAVATLEGLRPLLARRAPSQAIAICSTAAMHEVDADMVAGCLDRDEARTLALAAERQSLDEYASSKRALVDWLRHAAIAPEWAGSGIFLNGISPGFVLTGMTQPMMSDPALVEQIRVHTPRAVDYWGKPEMLAEAILAIANLKGGYVLGQILHVDGGTDAIKRPRMFG
jgi:NAD(P)-dependent dehydrogenase (short-subunit alcohol dehydrogenase family)